MTSLALAWSLILPDTKEDVCQLVDARWYSLVRRTRVITVASLVLLVGLHSLVGGGTADELVGPFGLMGAIDHLFVVTVLLGIVYRY